MDKNSIKKPEVGTRVDINESEDVSYWMWAFECSQTQLKNAVRTVGVSALAVKDFLSGKNFRRIFKIND